VVWLALKDLAIARHRNAIAIERTTINSLPQKITVDQSGFGYTDHLHVGNVLPHTMPRALLAKTFQPRRDRTVAKHDMH
jgi:hypothetical protein